MPGAPDSDLHWLGTAVELSRRCPPSDAAFSVGAIIVSAAGDVLATGYSRETDPKGHAEEIALRRAEGAALRRAADPGAAELATATLYSSLEPCLLRASRPASCSELIAAAGVGRVVIAWLEPPLFVPHGGAAWLAARGVSVLELTELAGAAKAVNAHLLPA